MRVCCTSRAQSVGVCSTALERPRVRVLSRVGERCYSYSALSSTTYNFHSLNSTFSHMPLPWCDAAMGCQGCTPFALGVAVCESVLTVNVCLSSILYCLLTRIAVTLTVPNSWYFFSFRFAPPQGRRTCTGIHVWHGRCAGHLTLCNYSSWVSITN